MRSAASSNLAARLWLGLCLLAGPAGAAAAQTATLDAERGRAIAERVCVGCHAIDREATTKLADVPSFPVIANRPGRTAEFITNAMLAPHPAMPGVPLTTQEMRDLAAYILSFRTGK